MRNLRLNPEGIALITLGIIFLLNTTGLLAWDIWWQFLPLLLPLVFIQIGLGILVSNKSIREWISASVFIIFVILGVALYIYSPTAMSRELVKFEKTVTTSEVGIAASPLTVKGEFSFSQVGGGANLQQAGAVMVASGELLPSSELKIEPNADATPPELLISKSLKNGKQLWIDLPNPTNGENIDLSFAALALQGSVVSLDSSFSNLDFDFKNVALARLELENSFGNVDMDLPNDLSVSLDVSNSFGNVSIFGKEYTGSFSTDAAASPETGRKNIRIVIDNSFGNINIY